MDFYNTLAQLNNNTYKKPETFKDYTLVDVFHGNTGLDAFLYAQKQTRILVIQGTNLTSKKKAFWDIVADLSLVVPHWLSSQYKQCVDYFKSLYSKDLIITGYSLGGSIAQMLGTNFNNTTVTFEAYGTGKGEQKSNIINFGLVCDPVFIANYNNHTGLRYIIPTRTVPSNLMACHLPGNFGNPAEAKRFDGTFLDLVAKYSSVFKQILTDYTNDGLIQKLKALDYSKNTPLGKLQYKFQ